MKLSQFKLASIGALALLLSACQTPVKHETMKQNENIRIASFNVSMEALNYLPPGENPTGSELNSALLSQHQQIKNVAEIIQRTNADIILLNEFDYIAKPENGIELFLNRYLSKSQRGATPIDYPYYYYSTVNTGEPLNFTDDRTQKNNPSNHGFGYFPGHFAMVLLSKYPIDHDNIRTFQHFLWKDMPNALQPIDPSTNAPWYDDAVWQQLRLSSKSHWDIPVKVNDEVVHILASHPTPPVFDGEEDRNGKRNHDEVRFWLDYISADNGNYIYDDNKKLAGLGDNKRFVIVGDLNASPTEGDAINQAITSLVNNKLIININTPKSEGGQLHSPDIEHAAYHTAAWRMRADYVLPSKAGFISNQSGVYWPIESHELHRLVKDRKASSDHRLVWHDLTIIPLSKTNIEQ